MGLVKLWADLAADLLRTLTAYRSRLAEFDVYEKPDRTLLTEADLAIEAMIIERIRAWDPEARVLAEESGSGGWREGTDVKPERVWVIDPIDGTAELYGRRTLSSVRSCACWNGRSRLRRSPRRLPALRPGHRWREETAARTPRPAESRAVAVERELGNGAASVAESVPGVPKVSGMWIGARTIGKQVSPTGTPVQRFLYKEFIRAWNRAGR